MLLYEKYTPYTLNGIIGNKEAIEKLKEFGREILLGKRPKPLLLYGPSGVGKTAAANALANVYGFGLILLSASDYRDAETLRKKLLPATLSHGLFNKINLIVFDEIDELSSQFDKGAQNAILQILQSSKQPILFIATDFWDQHISFLRTYVEKVEFKRLTSFEVLQFLKHVCSKEGAKISESVLEAIAERSNGDMRAALNDLEFVINGHENALEYLAVRNQKVEIFQVLDKIFFSRSFDMAKEAFDNSDIDFDMLIKWIDENIPTRYEAKEAIAEAYGSLSLASRYANKASRLSYYSLLRYASTLCSAGVALSNSGYAKRLGSYTFPKEVKYLSQTKKERQLAMGVAEKLERRMHMSKKEILVNFMPFFRIMLKEKARKIGKEALQEELIKEFDLSKEEVSVLILAY